MDPLPSLNPAVVNLDRTESELASRVAGAGSDEDETPTPPRKVREWNKRIYREIQKRGKRKKPLKAWFWQHGWLMEEEYQGKVTDERK